MKLTNIKHFLSTFVRENDWWGARPQREIFSGGTKVDTGPPQISSGTKLAQNFIDFCPKLGEEQKKTKGHKWNLVGFSAQN